MQSRVISFLNVWWYLEVELQPYKHATVALSVTVSHWLRRRPQRRLRRRPSAARRRERAPRPVRM